MSDESMVNIPDAPPAEPAAIPEVPPAVIGSNFGVEESKAMLNFVVQLANGIDQSLSDGKISLFDAVHFYGALKAAIPAFNNISQLKPELSNLNESEVQDLLSYAKDQLHLNEIDLQKKVIGALDLGMKLYQAISALKA